MNIFGNLVKKIEKMADFQMRKSTHSFPRKLHGGKCCAKRAFVGEKNNCRRKQQSSRNCGQSLAEIFTGTYQVSDR